jgi:hypothetical protein
MVRKLTPACSNLRDSLIQTYAIKDAMNQLLLSHLNPRTWRAEPPCQKGKGRTIAAIFAHRPPRVAQELRAASELSCAARSWPLYDETSRGCAQEERNAVPSYAHLSGDPKRRVTKFLRGSWAPAWPAWRDHVRVRVLARSASSRANPDARAQLGHRLPDEAAYGIWKWDKLWKQAGLTTRPREEFG